MATPEATQRSKTRNSPGAVECAFPSPKAIEANTFSASRSACEVNSQTCAKHSRKNVDQKDGEHGKDQLSDCTHGKGDTSDACETGGQSGDKKSDYPIKHNDAPATKLICGR
jgi:hypothetical protein